MPNRFGSFNGKARHNIGSFNGIVPHLSGSVISGVANDNLVLDLYPHCAFAVSTRKLRKDYTGPCMQVGAKREAINGWYVQPFDIYFDDNGNLDIQSFLDHPGVRSTDPGFEDEIQYDFKVVKWYNQAIQGVREIDYVYSPYFTDGPYLAFSGQIGTYSILDDVSNSAAFNNGRQALYVRNIEDPFSPGTDPSIKSYMNFHVQQNEWEGGLPDTDPSTPQKIRWMSPGDVTNSDSQAHFIAIGVFRATPDYEGAGTFDSTANAQENAIQLFTADEGGNAAGRRSHRMLEFFRNQTGQTTYLYPERTRTILFSDRNTSSDVNPDFEFSIANINFENNDEIVMKNWAYYTKQMPDQTGDIKYNAGSIQKNAANTLSFINQQTTVDSSDFPGVSSGEKLPPSTLACATRLFATTNVTAFTDSVLENNNTGDRITQAFDGFCGEIIIFDENPIDVSNAGDVPTSWDYDSSLAAQAGQTNFGLPYVLSHQYTYDYSPSQDNSQTGVFYNVADYWVR